MQERFLAFIKKQLQQSAETAEYFPCGESFVIAFSKPSEAVRFALVVQSRIPLDASEFSIPIRVDIGIYHTGFQTSEEIRNSTQKDRPAPLDLLYICHQIAFLGQPGRILMTQFVSDYAQQVFNEQDFAGLGPLSWVEQGPYIIAGLKNPIDICEVRGESLNA